MTQKPTIIPAIGIIMGSQSDWETMRHCADILGHFDVGFETKIISAHRTPDRLKKYANGAEQRGVQIIIAGAGGAAHLPGMCAAQTSLPVLGVPVNATGLMGLDSLLSIVQMPAGVPVGTLAVGKAGAINAGLLAVSILALHNPQLAEKWHTYRANQTQNVPEEPANESRQATL